MSKTHNMTRHRLSITSQILSVLPVFDAAARHGSFTRAARELGITQGAVSRRIQSLEEQLGLVLFSRQGKTLALTQDGLLLSQKAKTALKLVEDLEHELKGSVSGQLRLGTLPSLANRWLMEQIKGFTQDFPAISVDLITIPADFSAGHKDPVNWDPSSVDVALTVGRGSWPALESYAFCEEEMVLVCHQSLLGDATIGTLEDLLGLPRLIHSTRLGSWEYWAEAHRLSGYFSSDRSLSFEHFFMVLAAARQGLGLALLPLLLVEQDLANSTLVEPLKARHVTGNSYYMVGSAAAWRRPAVAAFRDYLLQST
ncbi:Glycine cleavage system transcriptional activator [Pseudovibrio axinellae]|uniref:Glycine cleavage system transcriptional activator n=1 Tax=Pseudovibrio axinellae TaxID=989403 RepID=A0A166B803_9HYPH|nr:LysR substrate-binding domain-containing protein [Pseudovibrio axinellae]KZL22000.1 Glycine cleavage system transcriptional activator [Pseudovibrio axinellae]SEQ59257.1 transcriptional regulator, LysR family [Pseudovibrio axinellae]